MHIFRQLRNGLYFIELFFNINNENTSIYKILSLYDDWLRTKEAVKEH